MEAHEEVADEGMKTLVHIAFAVAATLLVSHAAAVDPVEGTEVMVTDAGGHQLVGYGVVKSGLLMLRMGASGDSLALLLVGPDGSVESLHATRGAAGALLVDLPDGSRESLGALLNRNDVGLRILPQKGSKPSGKPGAPAGDGEEGGSSPEHPPGPPPEGSSGSSDHVRVNLDGGSDGG